MSSFPPPSDRREEFLSLSAIRSSFSFQGLSSWRYECPFRMFPFFSLFPPSSFPSSFSAGNSRYRERDLRQLSEPGRDGIHFPSIVLSIGSIVKRVANEERRKTWVPYAGTCRNSGGRGQRYTRRVRLRHLVATWVSLLSSGVVPKTFPFCTAST